MTSASATSLSDDNDLAICRMFAGWASLERRLGSAGGQTGQVIIDFNLPNFSDPDGEQRYASRYGVLRDLHALQAIPQIAAYPRLAQKLAAQEAYLRNLMGEHWDFRRYVEATMGFTPAPIAEDALAAQRALVENLLRAVGVAFDAQVQDRLAARQTEIPAPDVADFYGAVFEAGAAALAAMIGPLPEFSFRVEFDDVDAYWRCWVDGSGREYLLRFNRRTMPRHYRAQGVILTYHEIMAHIVQAVIAHDRIAAGRLPRCMGLVNPHGPDMFQLEGLAQSLTHFIDTPETRDPLLAAQRELDLYGLMVTRNNAHIMINDGRAVEDCVAYVLARLPHENAEAIAHSLSNKVNNPQLRCYEHVYPASALFFRDVARRADAAQKKNFLHRVYTEWPTAGELQALGREMFGPAT